MQAAMAQVVTAANEQTRRLVPTIRRGVGGQGAEVSDQSSVISDQGQGSGGRGQGRAGCQINAIGKWPTKGIGHLCRWREGLGGVLTANSLPFHLAILGFWQL